MNKTTKPARAPFFITELAEVIGGTRRPHAPTTVNHGESPIGTTRSDGEEGHDGGGLRE